MRKAGNSHFLVKFSGIALALALSFSAPAQASAVADGLQQFTSAGHVMGFDDGGYFTSNGSYALRVRFEGATPAGPVADGAVPDNPPAADGAADTSETAAPALERVSYRGVWPGVDVQYDAPAGALARSTWTVAAGADVGAIRLRYNRPVELTEGGELQIGFETGTLTESAPIAWQDVDGVRRPVEVAFAGLESDLVGFAVGDYRADLPLVIDPTLEWNTFLGGSGTDYGFAIAVDASGNVYVGGRSDATWGSPLQSFSGSSDAFAAKLDASGALVWNTFLGGSGDDGVWAIAVDASGNVYVGGRSDATWGSPLRPHSVGTDAFAAKLDTSGALVWNTFLGGSGIDEGWDIAVDASGNVYVRGSSSATWGSPLWPYSGGQDAFVAKLDSSGALAWNTFLGGGGNDIGWDIAVDASGNVYVGGSSSATWGSPLQAHSGDYDAFVAKLDSSGALAWNTFLGGSGYDDGWAIAVDASGNVYVGGKSGATWGSPLQVHSGGGDAFAAKLDASGALVWNTFLGGSGQDLGLAIAVDASGNVYVGGYSHATWGSPLQAFSGGSHENTDTYAAKLDASGALVWNTFLGGSGYDYGRAIAVDASGNVYVGGYSQYTWGSPLRPHSVGTDAFVAKLPPFCGDGSLGSGEQCDDGNTADGDCCSSTCQYEATGSACDLDGDVCATADTCDGVGLCVAGPAQAADGTACDDGNPCTLGDECASGVCIGPLDKDCSHLDDLCAVGQCNVTNGNCDTAPVNEGTVCDDGFYCTVSDSCSAGACTGPGRDCSAFDDACNAGTCDDSQDACTAVPNVNCDDADLCTDDSCDSSSGCVNVDNTASCDDSNPCTFDDCDTSTGCNHTPVTGSCDDGNACTDNDQCGAGTCSGNPIPGCESTTTTTTTTTSTSTTTLPACSDTLGIDQCKVKVKFRKVATKPDKLVVSCKVLDASAAVAGIDPSVEQMLFALDDAGGVCFTTTTDPADCVEKKGSFKCKPPKGTVPYVQVKLRPDRRNPGSYKLKYKAKDADLQCLEFAETPWTMGLEIGGDCGQVDCPSTGRRIECPGESP